MKCVGKSSGEGVKPYVNCLNGLCVCLSVCLCVSVSVCVFVFDLIIVLIHLRI